MSTLLALPRCVALHSKHDNRYLRTVHDESHGGSIIELSGSGEDGGVMNPRSRFYLEPSTEHDGLMHVKCSYNNKYWVACPPSGQASGDSALWIIGTADEPEEDLSKPSCTLFKHISVAGENGSKAARFLHSHLGKCAGVLSITSDTPAIRPYLHIAAQEEADDDQSNYLIDAFTIIDDLSLQLPKYVAFKGDNGAFLCATILEGYNYLQFSGQDIGDPRALQTTFTNGDGVIRIKSNYFDLFWILVPNWIRPRSDGNNQNDPNTLFRVVTGDGFIALQNMRNHLFCKRLSTEGKINCLNASISSITAEAKMEFYEPVVSRKIYDVHFRLNEARKYTKSIDGLYSQTIKNDTGTENKGRLAFTYTSTVQSTWGSTVSRKTAINVELQSGIPFLFDGKIVVASEFDGSYSWGKTEIEEKQTTKEIDVQVPPFTKVTVTVLVSNGVCDIPFSYKQRDVLVNGQEVIQDFTDGIYFGIKTSEITFLVKEENL